MSAIVPVDSWRAGVPEHWLVDARGESIEFEILRHTKVGYSRTRRRAGWIASRGLGKSFRITPGRDRLGDPAFALDVR